MKRWICLFLVMSSSLAHPNDREHGDFYRGLTGLKVQIDDAYQKISEASDAELRELSAQELEQVKQSKPCNNGAGTHVTTIKTWIKKIV